MLELKERKRRTLNEVVPDWLTGYGVMSTLTNNYTVPWKQDYQGEEISLDIAYQGGHSGTKLITPFVTNFVDKNTEKVSNADLLRITGAVWATYKRKWEKLWQLYIEEYDPLHNYDLYEEVEEGIQATGDKTGTIQVSDNQSINTSDTTTKTGTVQSTEQDTLNTQDAKLTTGTVDTHEVETKGTTETKVERPEVITYVNQTNTEDEERNLTQEDTGTQTTANSGTQTTQGSGTKDTTETRNLSTTTTTDNDTTGANNIFGFNSSSAVPSDTNSGTSDTTETKLETGTLDTDVTDSSSSTRTDNLNQLRTDALTHTDFGRIEKSKSESIITRPEGMNTATTSWGGSITTDTDVTNDLNETTTHTGTVQSTGQVTNNLTDTTLKTGTVTDTKTTTNNLHDTDTADREMTSHKYGNIGVASIQRMFKEEVENWKWTFMMEVFSDIDSLLVLAVW